MFVHAHGMAAQTTDESAVHESMSHEHCDEHAGMMADASSMESMNMDSMDMDAAMDMMDNDDSSQHSSSQPDCCQSLLCKCPCVQAVALSVSLPQAATTVPDFLQTPSADAPLLYAGVSGLFRPPI
jgi:hypothetical protein